MDVPSAYNLRRFVHGERSSEPLKAPQFLKSSSSSKALLPRFKVVRNELLYPSVGLPITSFLNFVAIEKLFA